MAFSQERIKKFFESSSENFDRVYSGDAGFAANFINRLFRHDIVERASAGFEILKAEDIRSVLDIGCGTGRLSVRVARLGKKVTGIDFSRSMIEKAEFISRSEGIRNIEFICADFMEYDFKKTFDACAAFGFFDYTADTAAFLHKISRLTGRIFVGTFPVKYSLRSFVRKIRLFFMSRPVYFYFPADIRGLFVRSGFDVEDIRVIGNLYFVMAKKALA